MDLFLPPPPAPMPYDFEVSSLPAPSGTPASSCENIIVRDKNGQANTFDVFMKTMASRSHPLQDGANVFSLSTGDLVVTDSDASTNTRGGVKPEDATWIVLQHQSTLMQACARLGILPSPGWWLRHQHRTLRDWLETMPGASCGIAQSCAVISASGAVKAGSAGDTQIILLKPGRRYRRPRLISLNSVTRRSGRENPTALGQSKWPLSIVVGHAHMDAGDLLVMGSDGGLPLEDDPDLLFELEHYARSRKPGRDTLATLGERLIQRARRKGEYDDDKSLILVERLAR